jgi:hypothetical protein
MNSRNVTGIEGINRNYNNVLSFLFVVCMFWCQKNILLVRGTKKCCYRGSKRAKSLLSLAVLYTFITNNYCFFTNINIITLVPSNTSRDWPTHIQDTGICWSNIHFYKFSIYVIAHGTQSASGEKTVVFSLFGSTYLLPSIRFLISK